MKVMIAGGSVIKRRRTLLAMRNKLEKEEAATFLASKKVITEGPEGSANTLNDEETLEDLKFATDVSKFTIKGGIPRQKARTGSKLAKWRSIHQKRQFMLNEEAASFLAEQAGVAGEIQPVLIPQLLAPGNSTRPIAMGPAKVVVTSREREDGALVAQIVTELVLTKPMSENLKKIECNVDVMMPHEVALEDFN